MGGGEQRRGGNIGRGGGELMGQDSECKEREEGGIERGSLHPLPTASGFVPSMGSDGEVHERSETTAAGPESFNLPSPHQVEIACLNWKKGVVVVGE